MGDLKQDSSKGAKKSMLGYGNGSDGSLILSSPFHSEILAKSAQLVTTPNKNANMTQNKNKTSKKVVKKKSKAKKAKHRISISVSLSATHYRSVKQLQPYYKAPISPKPEVKESCNIFGQRASALETRTYKTQSLSDKSKTLSKRSIVPSASKPMHGIFRKSVVPFSSSSRKPSSFSVDQNMAHMARESRKIRQQQLTENLKKAYAMCSTTSNSRPPGFRLIPDCAHTKRTKPQTTPVNLEKPRETKFAPLKTPPSTITKPPFVKAKWKTVEIPHHSEPGVPRGDLYRKKLFEQEERRRLAKEAKRCLEKEENTRLEKEEKKRLEKEEKKCLDKEDKKCLEKGENKNLAKEESGQLASVDTEILKSFRKKFRNIRIELETANKVMYLSAYECNNKRAAGDEDEKKVEIRKTLNVIHSLQCWVNDCISKLDELDAVIARSKCKEVQDSQYHVEQTNKEYRHAVRDLVLFFDALPDSIHLDNYQRLFESKQSSAAAAAARPSNRVTCASSSWRSHSDLSVSSGSRTVVSSSSTSSCYSDVSSAFEGTFEAIGNVEEHRIVLPPAAATSEQLTCHLRRSVSRKLVQDDGAAYQRGVDDDIVDIFKVREKREPANIANAEEDRWDERFGKSPRTKKSKTTSHRTAPKTTESRVSASSKKRSKQSARKAHQGSEGHRKRLRDASQAQRPTAATTAADINKRKLSADAKVASRLYKSSPPTTPKKCKECCQSVSAQDSKYRNSLFFAKHIKCETTSSSSSTIFATYQNAGRGGGCCKGGGNRCQCQPQVITEVDRDPLNVCTQAQVQWMQAKAEQTRNRDSFNCYDMLDELTAKELAPLEAEYPRRDSLRPPRYLRPENTFLYDLVFGADRLERGSMRHLLKIKSPGDRGECLDKLRRRRSNRCEAVVRRVVTAMPVLVTPPPSLGLWFLTAGRLAVKKERPCATPTRRADDFQRGWNDNWTNVISYSAGLCSYWTSKWKVALTLAPYIYLLADEKYQSLSTGKSVSYTLSDCSFRETHDTYEKTSKNRLASVECDVSTKKRLDFYIYLDECPKKSVFCQNFVTMPVQISYDNVGVSRRRSGREDFKTRFGFCIHELHQTANFTCNCKQPLNVAIVPNHQRRHKSFHGAVPGTAKTQDAVPLRENLSALSVLSSTRSAEDNNKAKNVTSPLCAGCERYFAQRRKETLEKSKLGNSKVDFRTAEMNIRHSARCPRSHSDLHVKPLNQTLNAKQPRAADAAPKTPVKVAAQTKAKSPTQPGVKQLAATNAAVNKVAASPSAKRGDGVVAVEVTRRKNAAIKQSESGEHSRKMKQMNFAPKKNVPVNSSTLRKSCTAVDTLQKHHQVTAVGNRRPPGSAYTAQSERFLKELKVVVENTDTSKPEMRMVQSHLREVVDVLESRLFLTFSLSEKDRMLEYMKIEREILDVLKTVYPYYAASSVVSASCFADNDAEVGLSKSSHILLKKLRSILSSASSLSSTRSETVAAADEKPATSADVNKSEPETFETTIEEQLDGLNELRSVWAKINVKRCEENAAENNEIVAVEPIANCLNPEGCETVAGDDALDQAICETEAIDAADLIKEGCEAVQEGEIVIEGNETTEETLDETPRNMKLRDSKSFYQIVFETDNNCFEVCENYTETDERPKEKDVVIYRGLETTQENDKDEKSLVDSDEKDKSQIIFYQKLMEELLHKFRTISELSDITSESVHENPNTNEDTDKECFEQEVEDVSLNFGTTHSFEHFNGTSLEDEKSSEFEISAISSDSFHGETVPLFWHRDSLDLDSTVDDISLEKDETDIRLCMNDDILEEIAENVTVSAQTSDALMLHFRPTENIERTVEMVTVQTGSSLEIAFNLDKNAEIAFVNVDTMTSLYDIPEICAEKNIDLVDNFTMTSEEENGCLNSENFVKTQDILLRHENAEEITESSTEELTIEYTEEFDESAQLLAQCCQSSTQTEEKFEIAMEYERKSNTGKDFETADAVNLSEEVFPKGFENNLSVFNANSNARRSRTKLSDYKNLLEPIDEVHSENYLENPTDAAENGKKILATTSAYNILSFLDKLTRIQDDFPLSLTLHINFPHYEAPIQEVALVFHQASCYYTAKLYEPQAYLKRITDYRHRKKSKYTNAAQGAQAPPIPILDDPETKGAQIMEETKTKSVPEVPTNVKVDSAKSTNVRHQNDMLLMTLYSLLFAFIYCQFLMGYYKCE